MLIDFLALVMLLDNVRSPLPSTQLTDKVGQ